MKRTAIIGIIVLLLLQVGSWLIVGRSTLPRTVARDIFELTHGPFFIAEDSLLAAPRAAQSVLRERLLENPHVTAEADLPPDNCESLGQTASGKPIYAYETPRFSVGSWRSSPIGAKVGLSTYTAPLGAYGYELRYYWILGFWVQRTTQNPKWVA